MNILFLNWLSVSIAISAFTFSMILTQPGHLLNRVHDFLEEKLPEYIFKPLIGCQYCVSGQWALWFYFYLSFTQKDFDYFWWLHIWLIMQTIFMEYIITYLYQKYIDAFLNPPKTRK